MPRSCPIVVWDCAACGSAAITVCIPYGDTIGHSTTPKELISHSPRRGLSLTDTRVANGLAIGWAEPEPESYELVVFPRTKERDIWRRLGVSKDASYEEIQDARNYLVQEHRVRTRPPPPRDALTRCSSIPTEINGWSSAAPRQSAEWRHLKQKVGVDARNMVVKGGSQRPNHIHAG